MRAGSDYLVPIEQSVEQDLIADLTSRLNQALPLTDEASPRAIWKQLVEVGVHSVLFDPQSEHRVDVIATIAAGLGAGLNADPFIWGAVVVPSLLRSLDPGSATGSLTDRIKSGQLVTVAMHGSTGDLNAIGRSIRIGSVGGTQYATGQARFVPLPREADCLLIVAADAQGLVLAEVLDPQRAQWEHRAPFDLRTPLAGAVFDATPVRVLGRLGDSLLPALTLPLFCQAAAIVGSAERALMDSVHYSRIREQFGRPIARFQAIRHRLAEMLVEVELMRTALWQATRLGDEWSMLVASYHCMTAAPSVTRANIQVHGGIGYTWEHTAHRHYRYAYAGRQAICSLESLERQLMSRLPDIGRRLDAHV